MATAERRGAVAPTRYPRVPLSLAVDEAGRIERARHDFGVLLAVLLPGCVLGPAALDSLFTAAVHRLDAVRPGRRRDAALDRLEQARRRLSDPARQVVLRDQWLGDPKTIRDVCVACRDVQP